MRNKKKSSNGKRGMRKGGGKIGMQRRERRSASGQPHPPRIRDSGVRVRRWGRGAREKKCGPKRLMLNENEVGRGNRAAKEKITGDQWKKRDMAHAAKRTRRLSVAFGQREEGCEVGREREGEETPWSSQRRRQKERNK